MLGLRVRRYLRRSAWKQRRRWKHCVRPVRRPRQQPWPQQRESATRRAHWRLWRQASWELS